MKTEITHADIMDIAAYAEQRREMRRELTERKKHRRMEVGPFATFYFENWDTMWHQVHEMLFIEKGGEAQIADELTAYNPLIPNGAELIATVMFEIDDPIRRANALGRLGGVEETMFIKIGDMQVDAVPEADVDRTTADGKASSVQFVHFPFTPDQIAAFRDPASQAILGIGHENYAHMAVMAEATKAALAEDFA
jgi:hypothetical protein